ncbi:hypothetical protein A8924_1627 [Saccharopolyspora erythraea NRRL 2338]|uniref:Uncharacterized protein n=2 Tax=Saccharopolyspora erythraea TaxID=1836 RepID=A4F935_SACEN|nr:hypothetical protein [Saccharopolyspora erythraea]EQD87231.1 hypothetical protein N599_05635 [Saccharopolyspora erythraea D]PFG94352.1 hypothetical protein A8924_1627 [Saccharopolyspora erythraea NRRL 2338]QRK91124.1 hypothetical protein JQX30_06700 [Saccharopolyspora erythraea]CAM00560.1 hypothetical protein SACE_1235 [Saccharopolyspora erythraea NRRL 2338]
MTYAQTAPGYTGAPVPPPARPLALLLLKIFAGLSAVLPAVAAIIAFVGGRPMAEAQLVENVDEYAPEIAQLTNSEEVADGAVELLKSMGEWEYYVSAYEASLYFFSIAEIVGAAVLLVWTFLARHTWARVLITLSALGGAAFHLIFIGAAMPPNSIAAVLMATWVFNLLAIVFCWLPPVTRHAKAMKLAR